MERGLDLSADILVRNARGATDSAKASLRAGMPALRTRVRNVEMELIQACTTDRIEEARRLFREYADWLQIDLCFQNFEKEVADLPGDYTPPDGRLWLAYEDTQLAGCVALRKIEDGICEMKRLFLRDNFRGMGLGRQLIEAIIEEAKLIGYERMRLDTLPPKMSDAIAIYRSHGFRQIAPYYDNPVVGAIFMELDLREKPPEQ
jgi:putative acetyltransferase